MKYCISILIALYSLAVQAQVDTNLYYFTSVDSSLFGIKRGNGEVLFPATQINYQGVLDGEKLTDDVIEFLGAPSEITTKLKALNPLASIGGTIYSRNGEFLYYALSYDNGSDYFCEGLRRYIDINTGLIGFVDDKHQIVIPAQWQFVGIFNYGYAEVFLNYKMKYLDTYEEHWTIEPIDRSSKNMVINKYGKLVSGSKTPSTASDYKIGDFYYPSLFTYTAEEQILFDTINNMSVLKDIALFNVYTSTPKDKINLKYELIKRPDGQQQYYIFKRFDDTRGDESYKIYVDKTTKALYFCNYWNEIMPLNDYIVEELNSAKDFLTANPDAPFKFDVEAELKRYDTKN